MRSRCSISFCDKPIVFSIFLQRIIFRGKSILQYYCNQRTSILQPWFYGLCICCLYIPLKFQLYFWLNYFMICFLYALITPYFVSFQHIFLIHYYYHKHPHQYILCLYFTGNCLYDKWLLFYRMSYCSLEKRTLIHALVPLLIKITCKKW